MYATYFVLYMILFVISLNWCMTTEACFQSAFHIFQYFFFIFILFFWIFSLFFIKFLFHRWVHFCMQFAVCEVHYLTRFPFFSIFPERLGKSICGVRGNLWKVFLDRVEFSCFFKFRFFTEIFLRFQFGFFKFSKFSWISFLNFFLIFLKFNFFFKFQIFFVSRIFQIFLIFNF